jgi:hypothetical protein
MVAYFGIRLHAEGRAAMDNHGATKGRITGQ